MCKQTLWGILLEVLVATVRLSGQTAATPAADVVDARSSLTVSLRITVSSAEEELLVPYCSEGEGGTASFCNVAIHIEVKTPEGWRRMKPRHREVVLGGVPPDKWKLQRIAAGRRLDFSFAFTKDDFAVDRGQRLRAVVDAWHDEQSMRTGQQPIQLVTPAFDCP